MTFRTADAVQVARRIPAALSLVARHGRPRAVLYFGEAPGDDLMATAVLAEWYRARGDRPWYMTRHPALFARNPDVGVVLDYDPWMAGALSAIGVQRLRLWYHRDDHSSDRTVGPRGVHLIDLMCDNAGVPRPAAPEPRFFFAPGERPPRTTNPRVVVQSSAAGARFPNRNKDWFPERMQQVVDALAPDAGIVQIGVASDPPLTGVTDLRGKTSVRESAAVLASAWMFVGLVGFPMHLARAVGTPSVIVFGGREHPSEDGYPGNRNLFTELACSPCWLLHDCPYDRECMRRIEAAEVIEHARALLADASNAVT